MGNIVEYFRGTRSNLKEAGACNASLEAHQGFMSGEVGRLGKQCANGAGNWIIDVPVFLNLGENSLQLYIILNLRFDLFFEGAKRKLFLIILRYYYYYYKVNSWKIPGSNAVSKSNTEDFFANAPQLGGFKT